MVYIIQDDGSKNFAPAMKYGDLDTLVTHDYPKFNIEGGKDAITKMKTKLQSYDPTVDYLLLTGDPIWIGICMTILFSGNTTTIMCLKWDKQTKQYLPITINL